MAVIALADIIDKENTGVKKRIGKNGKSLIIN